MLKLDKKRKITVILTTAALSLTLASCGERKVNYEQSNQDSVKEITDAYKDEKKEESSIDNTETNMEQSERFMKEYISDLKEEAKEVKEEAKKLKKIGKKKLESEEFQEKKNKVKKKAKDLVDFVFNGKEINGYTFSDLSDEGKKKVKKELSNLDETMDYFIPDYKERFKEWTVEKGADAVDKYYSLKEKWNQYKQDVIDEYEPRDNSGKGLSKK